MSIEVAGSANERNPCFLANEALHPYIKMSDCSQVVTGQPHWFWSVRKGSPLLGFRSRTASRSLVSAIPCRACTPTETSRG